MNDMFWKIRIAEYVVVSLIAFICALFVPSDRYWLQSLGIAIFVVFMFFGPLMYGIFSWLVQVLMWRSGVQSVFFLSIAPFLIFAAETYYIVWTWSMNVVGIDAIKGAAILMTFSVFAVNMVYIQRVRRGLRLRTH